MLKRAVEEGESIGNIANLSTEELLNVVETKEPDFYQFDNNGEYSSETKPEDFVRRAIKNIHAFDAAALEMTLLDAAVHLSKCTMITSVLSPLITEVGNLWQSGVLKIAHEHMASAVVRNILGNMLLTQKLAENAPKAVATTPSGQLHELGALMAAVMASLDGWQVIYLGPNVPAEDIAKASRHHQARAIILSLIYPGDDPNMVTELKKLSGLVKNGTRILIGGRLAPLYRNIIREIEAIEIPNLIILREQLMRFRSGPDDL